MGLVERFVCNEVEVVVELDLDLNDYNLHKEVEEDLLSLEEGAGVEEEEAEV
jgi:hypothetical protein